jgi:hypothetical protein
MGRLLRDEEFGTKQVRAEDGTLLTVQVTPDLTRLVGPCTEKIPFYLQVPGAQGLAGPINPNDDGPAYRKRPNPEYLVRLTGREIPALWGHSIRNQLVSGRRPEQSAVDPPRRSNVNDYVNADGRRRCVFPNFGRQQVYGPISFPTPRADFHEEALWERHDTL